MKMSGIDAHDMVERVRRVLQGALDIVRGGCGLVEWVYAPHALGSAAPAALDPRPSPARPSRSPPVPPAAPPRPWRPTRPKTSTRPKTPPSSPRPPRTRTTSHRRAPPTRLGSSCQRRPGASRPFCRSDSAFLCLCSYGRGGLRRGLGAESRLCPRSARERSAGRGIRIGRLILVTPGRRRVSSVLLNWTSDAVGG